MTKKTHGCCAGSDATDTSRKNSPQDQTSCCCTVNANDTSDPHTHEGCCSGNADDDDELVIPTEEERTAALALTLEEAAQALGEEEPVAVAVATEFIMSYAVKVGELLRAGNDYLECLTPGDTTPALEEIAMDIVRDAVSKKLIEEEEANN